MASEHSELDYVLTSLTADSRDAEKTFDTMQWTDRFYPIIRNSKLSLPQVKSLLMSLAVLDAYVGISDSLRQGEVKEYVSHWALPSHADVVAFNAALELPAYLSIDGGLGHDCAEVLATNDEGYIGGTQLPGPLLVLFHLHATSPAYSTMDSLGEMGLAQDHIQILDIFFTRREGIMATRQFTGAIVVGALSNIEANKYFQQQNETPRQGQEGRV